MSMGGMGISLMDFAMFKLIDGRLKAVRRDDIFEIEQAEDNSTIITFKDKERKPLSVQDTVPECVQKSSGRPSLPDFRPGPKPPGPKPPDPTPTPTPPKPPKPKG